MAQRCLSSLRLPASSYSYSLICRLPTLSSSCRSFYIPSTSSSSSPFSPYGVESVDISHVKHTTLKEISENFNRISIAEPPKDISIVEPLNNVINISPDVTIKKILDPSAKEELRADSVLKKRRRKMNKHKQKRVRKEQRYLMRKLGK